MSDFLFSPGLDVKYFHYNTKEWVGATIVGPSTSGGGYIKLKYMRNGAGKTDRHRHTHGTDVVWKNWPGDHPKPISVVFA